MYIYIYEFIYIYKYLCIYTWNPNDLCFDWKRPGFGGFNHKNRGQTGSRYKYVFTFNPSISWDQLVGEYEFQSRIAPEVLEVTKKIPPHTVGPYQL